MAVRASRDGLMLVALVALVVGVGFALAYRFASPAPPRMLRMAAGPEGGAYALFADRYREELALYEIEVDVRHTAGTLENLELVRSGQADLALAQSGVRDSESEGGLSSLGSVFYEPLWIFMRSGEGVQQLSSLRGLRVDVGPEGSGTRALAAKLLEWNGLGAHAAHWLAQDGDPASVVAGLRSGDAADAVFAVGSVESPLVRALLLGEGIALVGIGRAEAYARLDRSLSRLVLPEGVVDLARNIPPADTPLVSSVAALVVGESFHPALADIVLQAAASVHGAGDLFAEPGQFPSPHRADFPLSADARRHYEQGPPLLQRYLPFWAATQIDRLKVMLIPLLALLFPLIRAFPPVYRWRVRSRIYRWYKELREIDPGSERALAAADLGARLDAVERIERELTKVPTPASYGEELYALRLHVDFVRRRLLAAGAPGPASAADP